MPKFIYHHPPNGRARLVATLQTATTQEEIGDILFGLNYTYRSDENESREDQYTCEIDGFDLATNPMPAPMVDLQACKPTNREISVDLSYHKEHGQRIYLAVSRCGAARATMPDEDKSEMIFMRRLRTVWPKAIISTK